MAAEQQPGVGTITHQDLTVPNAEEVRDFYQGVVGWSPVPLDMGEYSDYVMVAPDSVDAVAGICHARGANAASRPSGSCT